MSSDPVRGLNTLALVALLALFLTDWRHAATRRVGHRLSIVRFQGALTIGFGVWATGTLLAPLPRPLDFSLNALLSLAFGTAGAELLSRRFQMQGRLYAELSRVGRYLLQPHSLTLVLAVVVGVSIATLIYSLRFALAAPFDSSFDKGQFSQGVSTCLAMGFLAMGVARNLIRSEEFRVLGIVGGSSILLYAALNLTRGYEHLPEFRWVTTGALPLKAFLFATFLAYRGSQNQYLKQVASFQAKAVADTLPLVASVPMIRLRLHSLVQSPIALLVSSLRAIRSEESTLTAERVSRSLALAEYALDQTRTLAKQIDLESGPALHLAKFVPQLVDYYSQAELETRFALRRNVVREPPEPVRLLVALVLSEALTNAVKHAHASLVRIELDITDDRILLLVDDDGIGIRDIQPHEDLEELARKLNGSICILHGMSPETGKSSGTIVRLDVNLGRTSTPRGGEDAGSSDARRGRSAVS